MIALRDAGYAVSVPFGENTRYDLVIDDGAHLLRVQCKTGRMRSGAVRFATCSCYGHHARPRQSRRDYQGHVDIFGVYCPETSGVYLVPIEAAPVRVQAALRVEAPRNNQSQRVRFASDFELAKVRLVGEPARNQLRLVDRG